MGKLIIIIMMLFTITLNAQELNYDNNGKPNGIILTIDEAHKVDNDYDLLRIYKELYSEYEELNILHIKLVDGQKKEIELLEVKIDLLEEQLKDTNSINNILVEQNELHNRNSILFKEEILLKDNMIQNLNKTLKREKRNKWLIVTATIIGGSILYLTK